MILFISGTPGTGKSTLAEELGQRTSMNCINIGDLAKEGDLYDGFDAEYSCPIIDEDRVIHYAYFNIWRPYRYIMIIVLIQVLVERNHMYVVFLKSTWQYYFFLMPFTNRRMKKIFIMCD